MDAVWLHWLCNYVGSLFCSSNKSWQDGTVCVVLYCVYAVEWRVLYGNPNQYQEEDARGEEYPMEFIEHHYDLDEEFVSLYQERQINTMKDVLYDALNTQKPVIRVMGEDKPAAVVKSRLLKLDRLDIDYAIEQYNKQVTKVRNHKAYMLTVLYQAKAQCDLDISNQVMYDFYGAGQLEDVGGDDNGEEERMYSGPDTASYG